MLSHIKSAVKNSFIYGIGNISTKLVGFVLLPLYTKHLSTSDYGMLALLEATSQAIVTIFGLRLYVAFFRWYWDKKYISKQNSIYFTTIIVLSILCGLLYFGITQISSKISFWLFDSVQFANLVDLMVLSAGFQIIIQMPLTLMRLQEKAFSYSLFNTLKLIITLILTIYFVAYGEKNVEGIYFAQIIGQIIFIVATIPYSLKNIKFTFEIRILKEMLVFSYPLIISSVASIILSIADRYFLKIFSTLSNVGIYSLGYKIANTIQVFIVTSFQLSITPIMYKIMDAPDSEQFYSKILTYLTFIVILFVLIISLFSYEIIFVLSEDMDYLPAYQIVPILSIGIIFGMIRYQTQMGLNIKKKTSIISIATILTSILNIGLNLILIPIWSSFGAAIANIITQLVFWISIQTYSQKYYYIPYENSKIILMIGISVLFLSLIPIINPLNWVIRIALKIVLVGGYPIILYFFNFYEKDELNKIKNLLRKIGT